VAPSGRGRFHHCLRASHIVDVAGNGDVVAPIGRPIVPYVRGESSEGGGTLGFAAEPVVDIDHRVSVTIVG
jgi:hypothetical protein